MAERTRRTCARCQKDITYSHGAAIICRDCRPPDRSTVDKNVRAHVYERDNWRCHLCGKRTRTDVSPHDRLAPTLDHLIPRSLGGNDEPQNLKCAHRSCNSRKGARSAGEQLLLIA